MLDPTQNPRIRRLVVDRWLPELEADIKRIREEIALREVLLRNLVSQETEYIIEDAALKRINR